MRSSANTDMGFMHIPIFLTICVLLDQPFYHLFHSMDISFMSSSHDHDVQMNTHTVCNLLYVIHTLVRHHPATV